MNWRSPHTRTRDARPLRVPATPLAVRLRGVAMDASLARRLYPDGRAQKESSRANEFDHPGWRGDTTRWTHGAASPSRLTAEQYAGETTHVLHPKAF
jgi:hypothetical protein